MGKLLEPTEVRRDGREGKKKKIGGGAGLGRGLEMDLGTREREGRRVDSGSFYSAC